MLLSIIYPYRHVSRYQTALELLGEKTELAEELKANINEIKLMFQTQIDALTTKLQLNSNK
jgi:hypothetical protein